MRFHELPYTLGVADLLLTKLQIVELNEKDARDIVHLLSAFPVAGESPGEGVPDIDRDRFCDVLAGDWGMVVTVTDNLNKLPLLIADNPQSLPPQPAHDALRSAERLAELADATPKSLKWKTRARVGERMRWSNPPKRSRTDGLV